MPSAKNNKQPLSIDSQQQAGGAVALRVAETNAALASGFGLTLLIVVVMLVSGVGTSPVIAQTSGGAIPMTVDQPVPATPTPAPTSTGDIVGEGLIERKGEGRHFYTTIKIPPGAETLYLSGSGASRQPDGTYGDMYQQTIDTFSRFKETLEAEGWSMSDIVQVRAFAVAGEYGVLDFDGFNRAYRTFFGTAENPMKPVRTFVQIAGLVVPGWLVEIEIRAARMPQD